MKRIVHLFYISILIVFNSVGQSLTGIVTDVEDQVLPNVHVFISELHRGTISTTDGTYNFTDLSAKKLKVEFSIVGFESKLIEVDLRAGSQLVDVILKESVTEMEEIILSGGFVNSQDRSAVKITSKNVRELQQSASPSLLQNLSKEPGVDVISQGPSIMKPVIRGLSGNRVLSVYQGARIENQAWGKEHGVYIPEEGLERIEVIKGPASLLYGSDAMGGVLNFVPEKPLYYKGRETRVSLNGFSNTNGYQTTLWTKKRKEKMYHAFGSGYHSHADYLLPDGDEVGNSRFNQFYAHGLWGYSMPWGKIEGVYSASYTNAGIIELEEDEHDHADHAGEHHDDRAMQMPWQQIGDHIVTTQATFWWGDWTLKPHVSYQLNHRKEFEEHDHEFESEEESDEAVLDMELRTFRYDFKALNTHKDWEVILGSQGMSQNNNNVGEEWLIPNADTRDAALLSLLNWKRQNLQLQFGARYDYRTIQVCEEGGFTLDDKQFNNASFSFGGTFHIDEHSLLRANLAQGYRAPSLFELYAEGAHHGAIRYELGNAHLKSEKNREWDVNFHKHGEHMALDVAFFDNYINDFIYSNPTGEQIGNYAVYEHVQDRARLYGGEFGLDFHPHILHDLHLKSTLAVVYGENLRLNEPLPLMPPLTWKNEIHMNWDAWKCFRQIFLKVEMDYYAKQDRVSSEELVSEAYHLVNLGLGAEVKQVNMGLFARNVFNILYVPHLSMLKEQGIYNPGRNISLKLSYSF